MKYNFLLEKFQNVGSYHIILAIVLNITMIMSYYIILSISIEQIPPIIYCKKSLIYEKCDINSICENPNIDYYIDYNNSVLNWKLKHNLICEREIYFSYLTSMIYLCSIISALIISLIADKMGRKFIFRVEIIANIFSYLLLYIDLNLSMIFVGVFINEIFSHIFNTSVLYLLEYFPKNYYMIIMTIHNVIYGIIGLMISSYVDYYHETSFLILIIILFGLIILLYNFTLLTESPDWLLSQYDKSQKKDKYVKVLIKEYGFVCKFNNLECDIDDFNKKLDVIEYMYENNDNEKNENFFNYFSGQFNDKVYIKHFILSIFLWIVNQTMFYGFLTNLDLFGNEIEGAYKLFFLSNIISNILIGIFSSKLDLYYTVKYFSWITSVLILVILNKSSLGMITQQILFFLLCLNTNFVGETIYLLIPELFLASIRSTSVSYTKIPAKILLIISPFILRKSIYTIYYTFFVLSAISPIVINLCI